MTKLIINYFKKYPYALVMLLVVFVWATMDTIEADKINQLLEKEGKFTLARIKKIEGAHSGRYVTIEFHYNGHIYDSEGKNETIPLNWIGEKIFIKFLPSDPIECEYYDRIEIPDSILNLPPTVWDSLPVKGE
jgi:hypothetical protein